MKEAELYIAAFKSFIDFVVIKPTFHLSRGLVLLSSFCFLYFSAIFCSFLSLVRIWLCVRLLGSYYSFARIRGAMCINDVYTCMPDFFMWSFTQHYSYLEYSGQYLGWLAIDSVFPYCCYFKIFFCLHAFSMLPGDLLQLRFPSSVFLFWLEPVSKVFGKEFEGIAVIVVLCHRAHLPQVSEGLFRSEGCELWFLTSSCTSVAWISLVSVHLFFSS